MTICVQVEYYGRIGRAAGCAGDAIELPENSVLTELIQELVARYGLPMEKLLLTDGGELRAETAILINGCALSPRGLATALQDGDNAVMVALVPALTGG
jgi:molybdopterin converting factor small subunit